MTAWGDAILGGVMVVIGVGVWMVTIYLFEIRGRGFEGGMP